MGQIRIVSRPCFASSTPEQPLGAFRVIRTPLTLSKGRFVQAIPG